MGRGRRDKTRPEELLPIGGEAGRSMFELFQTYDGEEYTVYTRDDGKKFYVDFEEQVLLLFVLLFTGLVIRFFNFLLHIHVLPFLFYYL